MEEEREITHTGQPLDIYKAKLTFRKRTQNSGIVTIQIRYSKRKSWGEKLPFPEDINGSDLIWTTHQGERIAVYRRGTNKYRYTDIENSFVHTDLGQKLERLVREVYFKTPKKILNKLI